MTETPIETALIKRGERIERLEADLDVIIAALDAHDAKWAHRHVSKRPNVPEALRKAINNARRPR